MKILGIDVGGTNIDCVIFDGEFTYLGTYPTSDYIKNFEKFINKLLKENNADAVGVGVALWIKEGKPVLAPNLPEIPELSDSAIFFENDANCFAIYSHHIFNYLNIFAVTVGTGVGGGIIINGELYRGGGLAGEVGHVVVGGEEKCTCGGKGHLEAYFGGWALKKKYRRSVRELLSGEKFFYSSEEFRLFCREIANVVTILDPEAVVFGGRIGMNIDKKRLKECVYSQLMPYFSPKIEILCDELAVAKGACVMAMNQLRQKIKNCNE
ncbi:MAG TPA: ROK family protein [Archaeoglobaceae archaeon]|nr:ROK family protein [Archaeoglobaceae archaeon]